LEQKDMEEALIVSVVGLVFLVVAIGIGLLINGAAERKKTIKELIFG
jgi:hypothetical protein